MKPLSNKICNMKPSGIREFSDYASERPSVISLGVGEPDFVTPSEIVRAAKNSIDEGKTFYTSNKGLPELRLEISNYLKREFCMDYQPEEIILTAGSSQGILSSLMTIINPGDEVIVTEPTYICYIPDIEMCGGISIVISLTESDRYKLKPEILEKYIANKTKAILLSYPNNPTGATMDKFDLEKIAQVILKHDLYVLSDEIYAELTYGDRHCSISSLPCMKERTIVINGFSKSFAMTGWRLGYVCAPKIISDQILKIQQYVMLSAPTAAQYGAISGLKNCKKEIEKMKNEYDIRRKYLLKSFKDLNIECFEATGAFYLFPSIKKFNMSSREFSLMLLRQHNILVVPGTTFGNSGEGYIRISYSTSMEKLEKFISVLKEINT